MSTGWLVDHSALALSGQPAVAARLTSLLRAGVLWSSPLIELEALAAADCGSEPEYRELARERHTAYRPAALGPGVGARALALQGRLVRRDRRAAVSPQALLAAATAIENQLTLLHYDPVFDLLGSCSPLEQEPVVPLGSLS
jgi:predicted nucleic acid-binding protein